MALSLREPPGSSPARRVLSRMFAMVTEEEIRARAHELWQLAGEPEGKEHHFWIEAERELREQQIRDELKTPDDL
jgi:hypothetical protein